MQMQPVTGFKIVIHKLTNNKQELFIKNIKTNNYYFIEFEF